MAKGTVTPATMQDFVTTRQAVDDKMIAKPAEVPPPPVAPPPEASPPAETTKAVVAEVTAQAVEETSPKTDDETTEQYSDRVQKRINKLIRERKEEGEFAQSQFNRARAAEKRLEEVEAENLTLKSKVSPPPAQAADEKPDRTKYTDAFQYAEDLASWSARQAVAKDRKDQADQRAAEAKVASDRALADRIAATAKELPDYNDVVTGSPTMVTDAIKEFIYDSEIGPLIGYHLAKNPAEAERINALPPGRAFAELGKLEEKLAKPKGTPIQEAKTVANTPERSRAPAPITPLQPAKTPVTADPSKMEFKQLREYERQRSTEARRH